MIKKKNVIIAIVSVFVLVFAFIKIIERPVENEEQAKIIAAKFVEKVYFGKNYEECEIRVKEDGDFWHVEYLYVSGGYIDPGETPEIYVKKSNGSTGRTMLNLMFRYFFEEEWPN